MGIIENHAPAVADLPDAPVAALTLRQILSGRTGLAFDPMRFGQLADAMATNGNFSLVASSATAQPSG